MARGEGSVVVRIVGEIRDLAGKLHLAGDEVGKFAASSKNVIRKSFDDISSLITARFGAVGKEANKALGSIADSATASGSAVGLGVTAGAAVAAAGLVKMGVDGIKAFVDLTSQVREFQRLSGATAEDSSRMVAALHTLGLETETGATGLFRLTRALTDHADTLKADGVSIARNKDGQVDLLQTLLNVSDAYKRVGAGAAGNKIAFDAFGRSGAALIPLLAAGRDRLEEFFAAAAKHNEVFSQDDLTKGRDLAVSFRELHQAVKGLEISLGEGVVPAVTDFANAATEAIDDANKLFKAVGGLGHVFQVLVGAIRSPNALLRALFSSHKDVATAADDSAAANTDAAAAITDVGDSASTAKSELASYASGLDAVKDAAIGVSDSEDAVTSSLLSLADESKKAAQAHTDAIERQKDAAQSLADTEQEVADRITDAQDRVTKAREDAGKINKPGQQRDEANARLADAQKDLARTQRDGDQSIARSRRELAKASQAVADATDEWTPSLDRSNEAGLKNRKTFSEIVDEAFKVADEMHKQGRPAAEIRQYLTDQLALVGRIGDRLGFDKDQLSEYLDLLQRAAAAVLALEPVPAGQVPYFLRPDPGAAQAGQVPYALRPGNNITINVQTNASADEIAAAVDRTLRRRG